MQILFLILKVIGVLSAVCILFLFSVVAVPVRYRMRVKVHGEAEGAAVFSWFFHSIDFRIWYGANGITYKLRIFGIPAGFREKKDGGPSGKRRKRSRRKSGGRAAVCGEEPSKGREEDAVCGEEPSKGREEDAVCGGEPVENGAEMHSGEFRQQKKREQKNRFGGIRKFSEGIRQRISELKETAAAIKDKIRNIKNIVLDETNRNSARKLWREMRFLMRHYSPRKVSGELTFGMGDPARTGQVLGALSVLPFWARYRVQVYPDFETEQIYAEGSLQMKGYIRLWHFLISAIRLLKDRDIKRLLKSIRM